MESLSEGKLKQLVKMDAQERAEICIDGVQQYGKVWTLFGAEGYVMMKADECDSLPIWPFAELALSWLRTSSPQCEAKAIELLEFKDIWLPGLAKNKTQVVLCPSKYSSGAVQIEANDLTTLINEHSEDK